MLNPLVEGRKKLEDWFAKAEQILIENESVIAMVRADMDAKSYGSWKDSEED